MNYFEKEQPSAERVSAAGFQQRCPLDSISDWVELTNIEVAFVLGWGKDKLKSAGYGVQLDRAELCNIQGYGAAQS